MSYKRLSQVSVNDKCSCKGNNLEKFLQPSILSLLATQNLHGYSIIQELENKSSLKNEKFDNAGIYRTLKALEERQLVDSEWNVEGAGAAKKIYKITEEGKSCLSNWVKTLEDYQKTIALIVEDAKEALK
ncbi:PadR family transcriptional regulator [Sinanaerobacter chloroacetimidivorans]|jgi:PadR family transcriptional regulator PadR|uniref:Helix-turn-helix transcriptional regulator n=1 Tax=Sinanaerobacter chloroacetimidivorans TaxID=2818044 RepID=A0A8J8B1F1_9FIRM|nr:PadR family transcriptional regulator [Sinanaerobacter chloroacetimidivorans]MBR0597596.1 helix-turn-helix transcriptional regulator [Sinanaerobacter chloroacetimidivorans]